MMAILRGERGAILGFAFITAFLASVAAYAMLVVAVSQARHARLHRERASARYAAEAGIVWGYERLFADTTWTWSDPAGDVDLTVEGMDVDVIVPPCGGVPPCPRAVQAKVTY